MYDKITIVEHVTALTIFTFL